MDTTDVIDKWKLDKTGKSPAYFAEVENPSVSRKMIERLKEISTGKGGINLRFCLQRNSNENLQDMVVLIYKDKTCKKPHKHSGSNEAVFLIEGELLVLLFDDNGRIIDKKILKTDGDFIYRNPQNKYHLFLPLTDYVVFREVIGGKFEKGISPDWDYIEVLKKEIDKNIECKNTLCGHPCALNKSLHKN